MPSLTGTTDHLPYSLRMGLARGTAISNAAPCSSLPSRRQRLRSLEDRRRRTHLPAPAPAPDPTPRPPKFSESRRRSVDDRLPRDPWHPSVPRCDPRSTAAACPCSPPYPPAAAEIFRVPPPFRRRSACSGPLAPLRAALRRSQHGRRLPPLPILPRPPPPPPKFSESRRRSVDDRPARDPWHPSAPHYDPCSAAAACPRSRSYRARRRRNFQSPAAVPWTIGFLGAMQQSRPRPRAAVAASIAGLDPKPFPMSITVAIAATHASLEDRRRQKSLSPEPLL